MAPLPALLADIGGTNTRLALLSGGEIENISVVPTGGQDTLSQALSNYLNGTHVRGAALAVAGPVGGGRVNLTNAGWSFTQEELADALGTDAVSIVNDFAAQALALPHLGPADIHAVGNGARAENGAKVVIGPGTGLGVAGLVPSATGWTPVTTEAGHITLAAMDADEEAVIARMRVEFGHVSAERVLSGPGLVALARALAAVEGAETLVNAPDQITAAALSGSDPLAARTLELFFRFLGTVAADAALFYSANGGVYIAGGIVPRMLDAFAASGFRARFETKGRFSGYLSAIETSVVTADYPAFIGLTALLDAPPQA